MGRGYLVVTQDKDHPLVNGIVTFLDALGWKGIWDRSNEGFEEISTVPPISALKALMIAIEEVNAQQGVYNNFSIHSTTILGLSDTIAIFTRDNTTPSELISEHASSGKPDPTPIQALEMHGAMCQKVIPRSIDYHIPMRGATSVGKFFIDGQTFVGPAVDEAAEWHESADWIGVHLTPCAIFALDTATDIWVDYEPKFKRGIHFPTLCVDWPVTAWPEREEYPDRLNHLKGTFFHMGPIGLDLVGKFINTMEFYETHARGNLDEEISEVESKIEKN